MGIRNKRDGFSLIEVALGLLIIGIIIGPMMAQYASWKNSQKIDLTNGNGDTVRAALREYALNNGCYPLPATPNVNSTSAAFGQEFAVVPPRGVGATPACATLTVPQLATIPPCALNTGVVCQTPCTVGAPSTTCAGGAPVILIGDVPFATLGLPKQYDIDGYGHKFTYAVSANLVQSATFYNDKGAVKVTDLGGGGGPDGTGPPVTNAHYAVVSHGQDGVGAFSTEGGLIANCAAAGKDIENCNNDGTFDNGYKIYNDIKGTQQYARQQSNAAGASHFDDFVSYDTTTSSDIWTKSSAAFPDTGDILNHTDLGNVEVKMPGQHAAPATPQAKLDVRGDVAADRLWTNDLCDTSGNSFAAGAYTNKPCPATIFAPDLIGGTPAVKAKGNPGIHCGAAAAAGLPAGIGIPMIGITAADENCASTSAIQAQVGYTIGTCPANQYPYGVNAGGTLKCSPAPPP